MAAKRVGFDFSGTLADDSAKVYAASRRAVESFGYQMPRWEEWKTSGCANVEEFLRYHGIAVDPAVFKQKLWANYDIGTPCSPYPGMEDLLIWLCERGARLFLVSCCQQDFLEAEVKNLGWTGFFDGIRGSLYSKRQALESLQLDLYVGDTVGDWKSSQGVCQFAGVGYGYGTAEQFLNAGLPRIAKSVEDLRDQLSRLLLPPPGPSST